MAGQIDNEVLLETVIMTAENADINNRSKSDEKSQGNAILLLRGARRSEVAVRDFGSAAG
jgi:hypothetical protein